MFSDSQVIFHCKFDIKFLLWRAFLFSYAYLFVMGIISLTLLTAKNYGMLSWLQFGTSWILSGFFALGLVVLIICLLPWIYTRHIFTDSYYLCEYNLYPLSKSFVSYEKIINISLTQSMTAKILKLAVITILLNGRTINIIGISAKNAQEIFKLVNLQLLKYKEMRDKMI